MSFPLLAFQFAVPPLGIPQPVALPLEDGRRRLPQYRLDDQPQHRGVPLGDLQPSAVGQHDPQDGVGPRQVSGADGCEGGTIHFRLGPDPHQAGSRPGLGRRPQPLGQTTERRPVDPFLPTELAGSPRPAPKPPQPLTPLGPLIRTQPPRPSRKCHPAVYAAGWHLRIRCLFPSFTRTRISTIPLQEFLF